VAKGRPGFSPKDGVSETLDKILLVSRGHWCISGSKGTGFGDVGIRIAVATSQDEF
jgi:hypothetical protein